MTNLKSKLHRLLFSVTTGKDIVNLGKPDERVLHYRDLYIHILVGEDDEHTSITWGHEPPSTFSVREIIEVKE